MFRRRRRVGQPNCFNRTLPLDRIGLVETSAPSISQLQLQLQLELQLELQLQSKDLLITLNMKNKKRNKSIENKFSPQQEVVDRWHGMASRLVFDNHPVSYALKRQEMENKKPT